MPIRLPRTQSHGVVRQRVDRAKAVLRRGIVAPRRLDVADHRCIEGESGRPNRLQRDAAGAKIGTAGAGLRPRAARSARSTPGSAGTLPPSSTTASRSMRRMCPSRTTSLDAAERRELDGGTRWRRCTWWAWCRGRRAEAVSAASSRANRSSQRQRACAAASSWQAEALEQQADHLAALHELPVRQPGLARLDPADAVGERRSRAATGRRRSRSCPRR